MDLLEGLRAMGGAHRDRSAAVLDLAQMPTTAQLTGHAGVPDGAVQQAAAAVRPDGLAAVDVSAACRAELGSRRGAGLAVIGLAWQRGWLPIPREALEEAIRTVTGSAAGANLRAFALGRSLAVECQLADPVAAKWHTPPADRDAAALFAEEEGWIRGRRGRRDLRAAEARARAAGLDEATLRVLAPRLPDVLAWGGPAYADRYLSAVERVADTAPALAPAAAHNLHRTMAIKDEIFVAHLLTSEKKYARDRERFGVDRSRGDRLSYVHLTRPSLEVGPFRWERDMPTTDGMLRLARRARFARTLLPRWHKRERDFRDWYEREALGAVLDGRLGGPAAEEAVRLPERVTGFRTVRYPKEDAAYRRLQELLREEAQS
jgi:indolepyruvate ferredoxin oxidoreductase